jgi:hypothetical protein
MSDTSLRPSDKSTYAATCIGSPDCLRNRIVDARAGVTISIRVHHMLVIFEDAKASEPIASGPMHERNDDLETERLVGA